MSPRARTRRRSRGLVLAQRILDGVLPAADGGPPPAVANARSRLRGLAWVAGGTLGGAVLGFVISLIARGVPDVPATAIAFGLGALLGAGIALAFAARSPVVRRHGALAVALVPLLLVAAPFLLMYGALAVVSRRKRS